MSGHVWRANGEVPANFINELYSEEESEVASDFSDLEDDDELESRPVTPEAPAYSPLSSPRHDESQAEEGEWKRRERSRSPIWFTSETASIRPAEVVTVQLFDEDGMPIGVEHAYNDGEKVLEEVFLSPDAHAVFVSLEGNDGSQIIPRGRARGGRRSGRRGGRRGSRGSGRGRGQYRRRARGQQWQVGHPLTEIWMSDGDVPAELVRLARDVVRNRIEERNVTERNQTERGDESENEDDEYFDADGISTEFEWATMDSFHGREENFLPHRTGSTQIHLSAYDAFRSYWDDGILGRIVDETNQYASKIASSAFHEQWYDTNLHEILCLFGFWMMLGVIKMPTITSCFSTDPLLKTEIFRKIFTSKRYEHLSRALHFMTADPATNTADTRPKDRLLRLRPIITHLNDKFKSNYILEKNICIDESLTLWKGRLDIKQYIKSKASRFGIKTFELCESVTGYLWSFIVYTGKQSSADLDQAPDVLKTTSVVKNLMAPLLHKGYRLFMDNFYNSPLLARYLKKNSTDCVGTLRPCRRDVPVLINKAPLKRGEIIARHSSDVSVLAWQDKKRVTMISTCHGSATALPRVPSKPLSRPVPFKPQMVLDYNKYMGGVDLKDQMLEPYLLERKRCSKWYMKLFKRLLNVSILNSRILLQSSTHKSHDHLAFRLQLVDLILANHLQHIPLSRKHTSPRNHSRQEIGRLVPGAHWPAMLEPVDTSSPAQPRNYRKYCVVCLREGRKTIRTTFCCEACKVPLCIRDCFKSYHLSS